MLRDNATDHTEPYLAQDMDAGGQRAKSGLARPSRRMEARRRDRPRPAP